MKAQTTRRPTVCADWLRSAASRIEADARESLRAWILLGQSERYAQDMRKAAMLRQAATIRRIADRRDFLRCNGVDA